jgi:hypothetical protein
MCCLDNRHRAPLKAPTFWPLRARRRCRRRPGKPRRPHLHCLLPAPTACLTCPSYPCRSSSVELQHHRPSSKCCGESCRLLLPSGEWVTAGLPRPPCRATALLTYFPPSCIGRRRRVTTAGTLYPTLHRVAPLSSSTDSPEPWGLRSPSAAPLLHRRATRPIWAAVGELYHRFLVPSSGRQDPSSHCCPAPVRRCARASRRSSASHHCWSTLFAASATVADAAAAAAATVSIGPPCGRVGEVVGRAPSYCASGPRALCTSGPPPDLAH